MLKGMMTMLSSMDWFREPVTYLLAVWAFAVVLIVGLTWYELRGPHHRS